MRICARQQQQQPGYKQSPSRHTHKKHTTHFYLTAIDKYDE